MAVLIDPATLSFSFKAAQAFIGPVIFGTAAYVLAISGPVTAPPYISTMWKTTDGVTWTALPTGIPNDPNGNASCMFWDGVSPVIHIAYCDPVHSIGLIDFTMGPDTFSAPYGLVGQPTNAFPMFITQRQDGSLVVFYHKGAAPTLSYFDIFSGGAWLGETLFTTPTLGPTYNALIGSGTILNEAVGPGNTIHLFYPEISTPLVDTEWYYRPLHQDGSLGARVNLTLLAPAGFQINQIRLGIIKGGNIQLAANIEGPTAANGSPCVLTGTPSSAPVWSFDDSVAPVPTGGVGIDVGPLLNVAGTLNFFWWASAPADAPSIFRHLLYLNTNSGSGWGAPTVLFDANTLPPLPLGFDQNGAGISVLPATGGRFSIVFGAQTTNPAFVESDQADFALVTLTPAPPSPPTYWNPGSSESLLCEKNYPWSVPPKDRIPVSVRNSIPAPAANVLTELWAYQVPDGFWFVYDTLLFFAQVAGFVEGSGSLIFTLDVNTPTVGAALPVGRPLAKFTTNVGELAEPVKTAPVQLYQGDILRAKVNITDNTLGVGLPNVIHAAVEGWLFPHSRL